MYFSHQRITIRSTIAKATMLVQTVSLFSFS
jgi:hypothetical protein